jgi:hypothetical protein
VPAVAPANFHSDGGSALAPANEYNDSIPAVTPANWVADVWNRPRRSVQPSWSRSCSPRQGGVSPAADVPSVVTTIPARRSSLGISTPQRGTGDQGRAPF